MGIKELEDQWKSLERLSEMEGQVDHLRQEMKWAYVRQIEMVRERVCTKQLNAKNGTLLLY